MKTNKANKFAVGMVAMAALAVMAGSAHAEGGKFDVRVSPLVLLVGAVDLQGNMQLSDNLSVGALVTKWGLTVNGDELSTLGLGARGNWHFNGVGKNGPYVTGYAKRWSFDITNTDFSGTQYTGSTSALVFGALGGYQWIFDSMKLNLGAGYAVGSMGDVTLSDSGGNTTTFSGDSAPVGGLAFDATIGWSF